VSAVILGLVGATLTVGAWAATGPTTPATDPTTWLGLIGARQQSDARLVVTELLLAAGLLALIGGWWWLQRLATREAAGLRAALTAWLLWTVPFALGPPLGSRDVWAYAAQGELARRGLDPSRYPVSALGPGPLLAAVDPRWRETRPPYGGLGVLLERGAAAVGGGHPLATVVVLRVLAVLAVAVLVLGAARLAPRAERARVVVLVGGCPPLLIHLVSGAHLDAVAAALLVLALLLAGVRAGTALGTSSGAGRWQRPAAVVVCGVAATAKLFVLVAAAWLTAAGLAAAGLAAAGRAAAGRTAPARRWRAAAAVVMVDAAAVVAGIGLAGLAAGTGASFLSNLSTPGLLRTHLAPVDLAALLLDPVVPLDAGGTLALTRAVGGGVAVVVAVWLVLRRPGSVPVLAAALAAVAVLGPVFYPWYLAPVVPLLAIIGERSRRSLLLGGVALSLVTLPTLTPALGLLRSASPATRTVLLVGVLVAAVLGAVLGAVLARRAQTSRRRRSTAAPARTTTA